MSFLKYLAVFTAGAGVGYLVARKYYDRKLDELLEFYEDLEETTDDILEEQGEPKSRVKDMDEKEEIPDELYRKYNTISDIPPIKINLDRPYEIHEDEFGEIYGYNAIYLTYYADRVLTDEHDNVIDPVGEIVGDVLNTSETIEVGGDVYVRNDQKRCDYDIFIESRTFASLLEEEEITQKYMGE